MIIDARSLSKYDWFFPFDRVPINANSVQGVSAKNNSVLEYFTLYDLILQLKSGPCCNNIKYASAAISLIIGDCIIDSTFFRGL